MPHVIRLRGPWEYEPLARWVATADGQWTLVNENLPPAGTIPMPADWSAVLGPDFRGVVRFTRRFHRPTGLSPQTSVRLIIEDVYASAVVALNGRLLDEISSQSPGPSSYEISADLQPANEVRVDVAAPPEEPPGRLGLVQLEIGDE
jgi:hypothetical protein